MNGQLRSRTAVTGLALAAILGASAGAFVAGIVPAQDGMPGRAVGAWTDRLTQQAEAYREERVNDAWTNRLRGQGMKRVREAWTARLNAQADAQDQRGMSERARQAWTDRLTGLAEDYFPDQ